MELNILKKLADEARKIDVSSFIKELTERLEIMGKKLTVDRFEGKFAICEDRENNKIYNIPINELPKDIKEGMIIKFENGKYVKDVAEQQEISNRIKDKMQNLWN